MLLDFLWWLTEGWEKHLADLRGRLGEHEAHSVIKSLRAHSFAFIGVNHEAAQAWLLALGVPLGEEILVIYIDIASNVILSRQNFDMF